MSLTTMSNLNDDQINLHCYLVPSPNENEALMAKWKKLEKSVSRTSSLGDLSRELEQSWSLSEGLLTFILFNDNQVRSTLPHKNFKPFRREPSPSTIYLYQYSCVKDEAENGSYYIHCSKNNRKMFFLNPRSCIL